MSNILKDISKKNPVGEDSKYEDSYLVLEAEIDKSLSATSAGQTDWRVVIENAEEILSTQTKDLKIVSYWLYAQWRVSNWDGLISSLPLYREFLEKYHNKMYPKSVKVKSRTLEWLVENFSTQLVNGYQEEYRESFESIIDEFSTIEGSMSKIFNKKKSEIFSPLIRRLKKKLNEQPVEVEQEERVEGDESEEESLYIVSPYIQELKETIVKNMSSLSSLRVIKLLQTIGSLEFLEIFDKNLEQVAESFYFNSDDVEINELWSRDKDKLSLDETLQLLIYCPVWMDGYYLLINLLREEDDKSKDKILSLEALLYDFLFFIDGNISVFEKNIESSQFFSYDLIKFYKEELDLTGIKNEKNNIFEKEYAHALLLSKKGKTEEALIYLDELSVNSRSAEETFLWRLEIVELAVEVGNRNLALALLYDLETSIEEYKIDIWQPYLAIKVYKKFLKPSINKQLTLEKKEIIYHKLCKISPKEAIINSFL